MAPGLISSLSQHELQERHPDAPHNERVYTSNTASPQSQASPVLHAEDMDTRVKMETSTGAGAHATQGAAATELRVSREIIEKIKKMVDPSPELSRQLDEILIPRQATYTTPRSARAYSESSLAPQTTNAGTATGTETIPPKKRAPYQTTVRDCTDSEDDDTPTPSRVRKAPAAKNRSQSDDSSDEPEHIFAASAPTSPLFMPNCTAEPSAPAATPVTKEVRFSDRHPGVLQRSASTHNTAWTSGTQQQQAHTHLPREGVPSPLDEKWGVLFTPQGKATTRMRNVLRGLAMYLIEVNKPAYSLVLTPEKMYKYYSKYRLERESIDLIGVFRGTSRGAMRGLEEIYLDLQCDYHLVQENSPGKKETPYIPALTPEGFVQWAVMLILANPNQEAARLGRVIADLPLEALAEEPLANSEQRDRLPRKISRHLFPREPTERAAVFVKGVLQEWKHGGPVERPAAAQQELRQSAATGGRTQTALNPAPQLIHSDARSRQENLTRCRHDYKSEMIMDIPRRRDSGGGGGAKRSSPEREGRSSRYMRSHARQESPRRDRRPERRDSKEPERDRYRRDRGGSADDYDDSRHYRRDRRGSRG